jgi:hypothetical protein
MSRNSVLRCLIVLLVLVVVLPPAGVRAEGPSGSVAERRLPSAGAKLPESVEKLSKTEYLQQAAALKESLSAEQQAALAAVMARYEPELAAIAKGLPERPAAKPASRDRWATEEQTWSAAEAARFALELGPKLEKIRTELDKEMAAVMTAEQWAQFQALRPVMPAALVSGQPLRKVSPADPGATEYSATYCYYAAQYASVAEFYAFYGYLFAYYNYYNNPNGSYNAFYYATAAETNTYNGLLSVAGAYFQLVTLGTDFNGFLSRTLDYLPDAISASSAGASYGYRNYADHGYVLAYYAYAYETAAYDYSNAAYAYAYYCAVV